MFKILSIILFVICIFSFPIHAEKTLSPTDVEQLPFDHSLANTPNTTTTLYNADHDDNASSHGHPEKKKAGMPQFDTTTFSSQIFWLAVMFVVLYVYFAKKALPSLSRTIEERETTISKNIDLANSLSNDIDEIRTEYEAAIKKAHNDARTEITQIEQKVRLEAERESEVFKKKSAEAIENVEKHAQSLKNTVKSDLEDVITDLTQNIVQKLSNLEVSKSDLQKAIANHTDTGHHSTEKKAA